MSNSDILSRADELLEKAKALSPTNHSRVKGKCPQGRRWDGSGCVDVAKAKMKTPAHPKQGEPGRPKIEAKGAGSKDATGRVAPKPAKPGHHTNQTIHIHASPAAPAPKPRKDPAEEKAAAKLAVAKSRRKKPHPEWIAPRLVDELGELHRVAKKEGIRFFDLMHHASAAVTRPDNLEPLDYGHWKTIENSDSYGSHNSKNARETARKHGRNLDRVIHGFRTGAKMQAPMVLVRHDGTSTLISGNTRLMAARAHGIRPKVMMIRMPRESKPDRKDKRESYVGGISKAAVKSLQELLQSFDSADSGSAADTGTGARTDSEPQTDVD